MSRMLPGDVPILDYDPTLDDVVMGIPPRILPVDLFPPRAVIAFLASTVDDFAARIKAEVVHTETSINGQHPYWLVPGRCGPIVLVRAHLGAPLAVMLAEVLFRHGVREAVAVGSCGGLRPFAEGEWLVARRALRDEGTSYHYLPPGRWVDLDPDLTNRCLTTIRDRALAATEVDVWTTDAICRETQDMISARLAEGCSAVDMECSALAACAQVRGVAFGQILFTADSLAGGEHDPRNRGKDSHELALELALAAIGG